MCLLGHVHTLSLNYCDSLSDVSDFFVHTLSLKNCKSLVDVSSLGNVHNLDLNCCKNVTDYRALGGVHNLVPKRLVKLSRQQRA
jgi:hypothetical protein